MEVADDLQGLGVRGEFGWQRGVAMMKHETTADQRTRDGEGPAGVVIARDDDHGAGRGGDKGLGAGARFGGRAGGVKRIPEPDEFGWGVVGEKRAKRGVERGVAPGGKEVAGGAVALGVAPVEVGDDERARGLDEEREAGIEEQAGGYTSVNHLCTLRDTEDKAARSFRIRVHKGESVVAELADSVRWPYISW